MHNFVCEDAIDRDVDLFLHGGDLFEHKSTPMERNMVASWVRGCANHAPFVIVRGNHDVRGDLTILSSLEANHEIIVEEGCGVHTYGIDSSTGELSFGPHVDLPLISVAAMAWPRKAELIALLQENLGVEHTEQVARRALQDTLRACGIQLRQTPDAMRLCPKLLLAHAMVNGSVASTGQPLVGCDFEIDLTDLSLTGADAYLLGHIHKPQSWEFGGAPILYAGSPRRTAYGELEDKSYLVLTFEGTQLLDVERVPIPCQRMVLIDLDWHPQGDGTGFFGDCGAQLHEEMLPDLEGADVRFRYRVSPEHREVARVGAKEIKLWLIDDLGVDRVRLEAETIASTRVRSDEITRARTIPEKLEALWRSREEVIKDNHKERLFDKVELLEKAIREEA
jgi:exonuclease SbcD